MGVNSLPKTVIRQRCDCDLNPGPSAPESSSLITRLSSHPVVGPMNHLLCITAWIFPGKKKSNLGGHLSSYSIGNIRQVVDIFNLSTGGSSDARISHTKPYHIRLIM